MKKYLLLGLGLGLGVLAAAVVAESSSEPPVIPEANGGAPATIEPADATVETTPASAETLATPAEAPVLPTLDGGALFYAGSCATDGVCVRDCHPPDPDCECDPALDCGLDSDCPPGGTCNLSCAVCECG